MGAVSEFGGHVNNYMKSLFAGGMFSVIAVVCVLLLPQLVATFTVDRLLPAPVSRFVHQTVCTPYRDNGIICSDPRADYVFLVVHALCSLFLAIGLWGRGDAGFWITLATYWGAIVVAVILVGAVIVVPYACVHYLIEYRLLPDVVGAFFNYAWCAGDGITHWRCCTYPFVLLKIPAFHLVAALTVAAIRVTTRTPIG